MAVRSARAASVRRASPPARAVVPIVAPRRETQRATAAADHCTLRAGESTPAGPALGLPEAEKERGLAWATAALEEAEAEAEEGEEPLAAARPTAARGEPASAGECVRTRGPPAAPRPRPLPAASRARRPHVAALPPGALAPLGSCPPPAWDSPALLGARLVPGLAYPRASSVKAAASRQLPLSITGGGWVPPLVEMIWVDFRVFFFFF